METIHRMRDAGYSVIVKTIGRIYEGVTLHLTVTDELCEIQKQPANRSPADSRKLKSLEREYALAKVKRDRKRMSYLEKEIFAIRGK